MVVAAGTTVMVANVITTAYNGASLFRRARAIRLFMAVSSGLASVAGQDVRPLSPSDNRRNSKQTRSRRGTNHAAADRPTGTAKGRSDNELGGGPRRTSKLKERESKFAYTGGAAAVLVFGRFILPAVHLRAVP